MSIKALNWAWKMKLDHSTKFVLIALADYANKENECWPTINQLIIKCGMGKTTIIKNLKELEQKMMITKQYRYDENGQRQSTLYKLNTSLSSESEPSHLSSDLGRLGSESELRLGSESEPILTNTRTTNNKQTTNNPQLREREKEKESKKEKERERLYKKYALKVLNYLNEMRPGKTPFQPVIVNINLIINRMKELMELLEIDIQEATDFCTRIICWKQREWGTDSERRKYLRPKTLFHKTNFHQYFGDLPQEDYYE